MPLPVSGGDGRRVPVFYEIQQKNSDSSRYFLELIEGIQFLPDESDHAAGLAVSRWELPEKPLAAALSRQVSDGTERISVLTSPTSQELDVYVFIPGTVRSDRITLSVPDLYEAESGGFHSLCSLPDGLLAACWLGRKAGGTPADSITLLWGIDPVSGKTSDPLVLRGLCRGTAPGDNDFLWLVSGIPGTEDYYFNGVSWCLEPTGIPRLDLELERVQRTGTPYLSMTSIDNTDLLVLGGDEFLEVRSRKNRGEQLFRHEVPGPVRSLANLDHQILIGAGNQFFILDPKEKALRKLASFSTGQITGIFPFIKDRKYHKKIENDIKIYIQPDCLTFRASVVGRELRVIRIQCPGDVTWTVASDVPEILFHPSSGHGEGLVFIGLESIPKKNNLKIAITLSKDERDLLKKQIPVNIDGSGIGQRKILWHFAADVASGEQFIRALAYPLEQPPFHIRHVLYEGALSRTDLDQANLLAADFDAFSKGLLPAASLMEWIRRGNGLLLVSRRKYANNELTSLGELLQGMGIDVVLGPVNGSFIRSGDLLAVNRWNEERWRGDWWFRSLRTETGRQTGWQGHAMVTPEGEHLWDFLLFRSGYGRVALISSPAIYQAVAAGDAEAVGCGLAVIRWLMTAGQEALDADGDGLTDDLEDPNGNGQCDRTETDWTSADTDDDGVPDGLEDRNRNGISDPGETHPLLADTDDDGVPDGADPRPLIP